MDIVRNHIALESFDLVENIPGDGHAVGALFLRQRNGHRRGRIGFFASFLRGFLGSVVPDQATGVGRFGHHRGDIAHVHRGTVLDRHHQAFDILHGLEEGAGIDVGAGVIGLDGTESQLAVGGTNGICDLVQGDVVAGQTLGQNLDLQLIAPAANYKALAGVLDGAKSLQHIEAYQPQCGVIKLIGPQG